MSIERGSAIENKDIQNLYDNGDREWLLTHEKDSFPVVITSSFGPEGVNPTEEDLRVALNGNYPDWINDDNSKTVLVPMQANGRCIANCQGCVFASDVVGKQLKQGSIAISREIAVPTTADAMSFLLEKAQEEVQGKFRVGAVLSGDPAFNPHSLDVMKTVINNSNVLTSRWSTVAPTTGVDVLGNFVKAAEYREAYGNGNKIHFQVSLHSTDTKVRREYINFHGRNNNLKPISMREISTAFQKIHEISGRQSTVAFIVGEDDVPIDVDVLRENFNPESTWVSLRPRIPTPGFNVGCDPERLVDKYLELKENGWSVMVIPPTETGVEQHNLAYK